MKNKNICYLIILLLCTFSLLFFSFSCTSSSNTSGGSQGTEKIKIGVLLPLTGSGPFDGKAEKAALDIALEKINKHLEDNNSQKRIEFIIKDTKNDSYVALNGLKQLKEDNIKIVVASCSSEELFSLKFYADENGIILINHASTSPTLSVSDNIFRLIPDDNFLSQVMGNVLWNRGVRKVIFFYRQDIWGVDLATLIKANFQAKGGEVIDSINYDARAIGSDFDTKIQQLNDKVTQALKAKADESVAVQLLSFEEGTDILEKSSQYPELSKVKWYGSDGFVQDTKIIQNNTAAALASKVGVYCPIIAQRDTENYQKISNKIKEKIGYTPYSFAMVLYDALWVASLTGTESTNSDDDSAIKNILAEVVKKYEGVTGNIILNSNGDRTSCFYDFWGVYSEDGKYLWKKSFTYENEETANRE